MIVRRLISASLFALTAAVFCLGLPVHAQDRGSNVPRVSPNATVSQTIGVTEVRITYGRPSVRGREIFGGLVPFGEVWRTGANEATTISFSTPVQIQGEALNAGTYGFFTIPGPDSWTLIFNEQGNQWGAYSYDASKDVLRVEATPESAEAREMMTFSFRSVTDTSATAVLRWAKTRVPFTVTVNTPQILRSQAKEAVANADDWRQPLPYVSYALENDILIDEVLTWVNKSIELEERYENLRMKAHVLAADEQYAQAVKVAKTAVSNAESREDSPDGLDELRRQIKGWQAKL